MSEISSGDRIIFPALKFSFSRENLQLPGIGMMYGFLQSIQAREICAGVEFFPAAKTLQKLCRVLQAQGKVFHANAP